MMGKTFYKCPHCGLFEESRTSCACGYSSPIDPLPPTGPSPNDSDPLDSSGIALRFIALNMLRLAIPFGVAIAAVDLLTSPVGGVQWNWTVVYVSTGLFGGAMIGLIASLVAILNGRFHPRTHVRNPSRVSPSPIQRELVEARPPRVSASPPPARPHPLLWLIVLPLAGYLAGTLHTLMGGMAAVFVSVGFFVVSGVLAAHVLPKEDPAFMQTWVFRSTTWLLFFTFLIALMLAFGTVMFWWVVPILQGSRRFDMSETLIELEPRYPVIGLMTGVALSLLAQLPDRSTRNAAKGVRK